MAYYDERKKELEAQFNKNKERAFSQIIQIVAQWNADAQELQEKFREMDNRQKKEEENGSNKKK